MPPERRARGQLAALCCAALLACPTPPETAAPAALPEAIETPPEGAANDPYLAYLATAPEYRPVDLSPERLARWDAWLYMPWRYRWAIGTEEAGGKFAQQHGMRGGVSNQGRGPLDWLTRWGLRFYNDHTAGKGGLHLLLPADFRRLQADPRAVRTGRDGPRPLDAALLAELEAEIDRNVARVGASPLRVAYALDDEPSWGSFVRPVAWRVNGDDEAYGRWLRGYYGPGRAPTPQLVTPEHSRAQLDRPLADIDLSPLLDRLSYNDSVWANFVGDLVRHANREDPATPAGLVGLQAPNAWGGYDYAKLAGKIQFAEAYDVGSAQEILRSFLPAAPRAVTHFHRAAPGRPEAAPEAADDDVWLTWRTFAHGHRGLIGWVDDGWFDGARPRPWLARYGRTLREIGETHAAKLVGARFLHDGIALYYSHPSIQVSWCLDAEPHAATWPNRDRDHRLGTSHNVRRAWELLLNDAGLQYDFLAYDQVARHGVPAGYRVLILPACYALSDAEARRIEQFAAAGGTVVADFACGLFDQHGRGRRQGALDRLFGVRHDGTETRRDFFGGRLWVESDQEAGYKADRYRYLLDTVASPQHQGFATPERRLPAGTDPGQWRRAGRGTAAYLNLSPQRYLQYRQEGTAGEARRQLFLRPVLEAGVVPRARLTSNGQPVPNLEVLSWSKAGRTLMLVVQNPETAGTSQGGGHAAELRRGTIPLRLELPRPVQGARDERTGRGLPDGRAFDFQLDLTEAVFFSFAENGPGTAR
jgi:Beta-galactosidase trimerisation domain